MPKARVRDSFSCVHCFGSSSSDSYKQWEEWRESLGAMASWRSNTFVGVWAPGAGLKWRRNIEGKGRCGSGNDIIPLRIKTVTSTQKRLWQCWWSPPTPATRLYHPTAIIFSSWRYAWSSLFSVLLVCLITRRCGGPTPEHVDTSETSYILALDHILKEKTIVAGRYSCRSQRTSSTTSLWCCDVIDYTTMVWPHCPHLDRDLGLFVHGNFVLCSTFPNSFVRRLWSQAGKSSFVPHNSKKYMFFKVKVIKVGSAAMSL
jgi:hypothetical protein